MVESDFYKHVFLHLPILAWLFWMLMIELAEKNNVETTKEKHIVLKILGSIAIAIGVVFLVVGIFYFLKVECPQESITQPITKDPIIRPRGAWVSVGYPTPFQIMAINEFVGTIQFVGLGLYLWRFRKSGTNWWQKTLKVVAYSAMFILLPSALDFHYYDLYEFVPIALLIVLATLCLINWRGLKRNNRNDNKNEPVLVEANPDKSNEYEINSTDVEL